MSKKSKPAANCVFCGHSGVTKQHMWPDWLKKIIPREGSKSAQMIFHVSMAPMNKAVIIQPDVKEHRGHQGTHKIRNVCEQCNSGWMSRLETKAKPHLTNLILGQENDLDKQAQLSLAAWTVMTSIMAEYTDIKTASIPAIHRSLLMSSGIPPDGWQIWLGRYHGSEWKQRYKHFGARLKIVSTGAEYGVQSSIFVIGELLIYTISKLPELGIPEGEFPSDRLLKIWPPSKDCIEWPCTMMLIDEDANSISEAFFKYVHSRYPLKSS